MSVKKHQAYIRSGLRVVWIIAVIWFELGAFNFAVRQCRWPDMRQPVIPNSRIVRILVMADPQIIDRHSYPGRWPILSTLTQYAVDLNLRKSWNAAFSHLHPNAIVVLGDMMDNGRLSMSTSEYEAYFMRYQSIFNKGNSPPPVYHLPGNHDIGLGNSPSFSQEAEARYISHFGPRNYRRTIGNHTLVFIDAPALVEEDRLRAERGHTLDSWPAVSNGPMELVNNIASIGPPGPVVLFTHIPLYRPFDASCGPLREKGTIKQGFGFGYQNLLPNKLSEFLLQSLQPSLIMSGDDHDYCELYHTIPSSGKKVQEITVKSISMVMGIRRPGFQLLSLISTVSSPDQITQIPAPPPLHSPCFLLDQLGIYLHIYVPLTVLSILALLTSNILRVRGAVRHQARGRKRTRQDASEGLYEISRDDAGSFLPPPANKSRDHRHLPIHGRSPLPLGTWTLTFGGRRRRITLPNPLRWWRSRADHSVPQRNVGLFLGFLQDIGAVAWPPVLLLITICWWVTRW